MQVRTHMKILVIVLNVVSLAGAGYWLLGTLLIGFMSPTASGGPNSKQMAVAVGLVVIALACVVFSHVLEGRRALVLALVPLLPLLFLFGPRLFYSAKNAAHAPLNAVGLDDRYQWSATVSAPSLYPVTVLYGYLLKDEKAVDYLSPGSLDYPGWGESSRFHISGPDLKSAPNKLNVAWFSVAENKFYKGEFDLPYETITKLMKTPVTTPEGSEGRYKSLIVGFAPGGGVSVWLQAAVYGVRTQVAYFQATEMTPTPALLKEQNTSEEYLDKELLQIMTPEQLADIRKNGVPADAYKDYQRRSVWSPLVRGDVTLIGLNIEYFDAEKEWFGAMSPEPASRPVPKKLFLVWKSSDGERHTFDFTFQEKEIFGYFAEAERLGGKATRLLLTVDDKGEVDVSVRYDDGKDSLTE